MTKGVCGRGLIKDEVMMGAGNDAMLKLFTWRFSIRLINLLRRKYNNLYFFPTFNIVAVEVINLLAVRTVTNLTSSLHLEVNV